MKLKRVLSLLMALVMTVSLMTLPVHAEDNDFASLTVAEQYASLKSVDNEADAQALFNTLTEQQQTALVTYAQTQAEQEYTVPQTVVFTEAGPFMPPVNVAPVRMKTMARAAVVPAEDDGKGLVFTKKATDNGNGTYTITMEAYTTGEVTTSTKTAPVDIVLVLDQSGSMAYDFNGNSTNTNSARRQYAMKQAVNNFIDKVNEKYSAEADHRMAIVTFGSNASTLQGWTSVDEAGKTTLQSRISGLPNSPSGATNVYAGMQQAETLMGSGYNYTGTNTQRQKVVIVFTDGVPTTQTDFDTTVATNAISSAKNLKDAGATVYTVGIFNGADPTQLHGQKADYGLYNDISCTGEVGSVWGGNFLSDLFGGDIRNDDIPAGNRFLNYLSSNFASASEIGISYGSYNPGNYFGGSISGYKITKNFTRTASNYYLTANDSTSLNKIFQTISEQIQTANIDLGSETVVKDKISPYFTAPANASDIHLYTAAAKSDGTFEDRVAAPDTVTATVDGDTVSVTGFNFNDNFVSDTQKADRTYGKKLIIEFTVTPRDGFLGGNNVPTNDKAAVYDKDGTEVEAVGTPHVNVPIKDVTVSAQDKNVYLLHTMTEEECKTGATATCNGVNLLDETAYTGENEWKAKFVTITTNITRPTDALTEDSTYTIAVTVTPKYTGDGAEGVKQQAVTNTATAKVNVFKPELTFKDSEVYYGDTAPENYNGNKVSEQWKHGDKVDSAVTMTGEKPTLVLTYTPGTGIADGIINTKQDVPVKATVKIGSEDVTQYTTFLHEGCNSTCGWTEPTTKGDPAFLLHVKTCTLTVQKDGWDDKDANQSFIFNVTGGAINQEIKVTVQENGSAKITGLPVGSYTVSEDGKWSWRYTAVEDGNATLSAANPNATVTIENNRTYTKWLSGDNYAVNHVGGIKMPQGTFAGSN